MQNQDLIRRAYINELHVEAKRLQRLLAPFNKNRVVDNRYEENAYNRLKHRLADIRSILRTMDFADPLYLRQKTYEKEYDGSRIVEETYYLSKDGRPARYEGKECRKEIHTRQNVYVFCEPAGNWNEAAFIRFNPTLHWKDDFMSHVRNRDFSHIHNKYEHFRVGDEFYDWDDFFLYNNIAYDRTKWAMSENTLIDLSKVVRISSDMNRCGFYRNNDYFKDNSYLESEEGESFECVQGGADSFIRIRLSSSSMFNGLLDPNFVFTMFTKNKKRFWTRNMNNLDLTKEECEGLEFKPSSKHKELYEKVKSNFIKFAIAHNQMSPAGPGVVEPNKFVDDKCKDCKIQVRFYDQTAIAGSSLKSQVLREIFDEHLYYSPETFKVRLAMLKEFLQEEKKYAK